MTVMGREGAKLSQQIASAWNSVILGIQKMATNAEVRPQIPSQIFQVKEASSTEVEVTIKPIVFKVPERANAGTADLFIAVEGFLILQPDVGTTHRPKTNKYGTRVGYFRLKGQQLLHVYGAHYDIDEVAFGHPVFHAQLGSQTGLAPNIGQLFHVLTSEPEDCLSSLLRQVRVPTAQMDVFSVVTQICADHLVAGDSGPVPRREFGRMRESCDFFLGTAHRLGYLSNAVASACYRSTHWYDRPEPAASSPKN